MSSSMKECEVITSQPSARSSSIPQDGAHPPGEATFPQNEEMGPEIPLIASTGNNDTIGLLNPSHTNLPNVVSDAQNGSTKHQHKTSETPKQEKNQPNVEADAQKKMSNSKKEAVTTKDKSIQPELDKNSQNYSVNGPDVNPGAANLGLSLCLMQFCNICTACCVDSCNEYYNWCCCCFTDSEICVTCCSGCMECCSGCDCAACCN